MSRTTRRDMLGALGFTGLAGITTAALAAPDPSASRGSATQSHPDAELVQIGAEASDLCAARAPLTARWWALCRMTDEQADGRREELYKVADAMEPIDDRLDELTEQAVELRAVTREGFLAKAVLIRHQLQISCGTPHGEAFQAHFEHLALTLVHDLLGEQADG